MRPLAASAALSERGYMGARLLRVLQNKMADRGVGRRDVIEPVRDLWLRAAGDIRHRAARDEPHHEFDALRTRLAHVFDVRHLREAARIVDQPVEEPVVPFLVDQARARPLKLMAHAAGAPDLDIEILGIAPDRIANRPAERETARSGGNGMLNDIDGEGDDLARPRVDLAEDAGERHREAMIDVDLVDHGEVEIPLDHFRGDMRGKLRIADHFRHRARAIALICWTEFRAGHDRESWDHLETKGGGVIVVDEEDHVRLLRLLPLLVEVVSGEDGLPVSLLGLAVVEGSADRGNVGGIERGGDAGHGRGVLEVRMKISGERQSLRGRCASPSSPILRLPSIDRPPLTIMSRYSCSLMPVIEPAIC